MRRLATRSSPRCRVPLVNLLAQSGDISVLPWVAFEVVSVSARILDLGTSGASRVEQATAPLGGTASRIFTGAAVVSSPSGAATFRLKNTQNAVVDNFSQVLIATQTPELFVFTVTNGAAAGNGRQIFGVCNAAAGGVGTVLTVHRALLFAGALTAQQIIEAGGIPITGKN